MPEAGCISAPAAGACWRARSHTNASHACSARAQAYVSPEAAVLTRLFVKLLADDLNEMAYDAELAGLSHGLHNTKQGFLLTFYGCAPCPCAAAFPRGGSS